MLRLGVQILLVVAFGAFSPMLAAICSISPKGDALIVKTDNPYHETAVCTVTCDLFKGGVRSTITCKQNIPPSAKNWYVCVRPLADATFKIGEATQSCAKQ
jgi:hypothetical protein